MRPSTSLLDDWAVLYRGTLYRFAYRILRHPESADDCVQEAFRKAAEADLDSVRQPLAWLRTVTTNVALNMIRDGGRARAALERHMRLAEYRPTIEETVVGRSLFGDLLRHLDPDLRTVVLLYYFEDMSVDQIATAVDRPANTVKTRLFRARRAIRRLLEER